MGETFFARQSAGRYILFSSQALVKERKSISWSESLPQSNSEARVFLNGVDHLPFCATNRGLWQNCIEGDLGVRDETLELTEQGIRR